MSRQFVFSVRHELTQADLAYAVAIDAEIRGGSTQEVTDYIGSLGKRRVNAIVRARLKWSGGPAYWPEVTEANLLVAAKERIGQLWGSA
jgi:hypothetical protein